jgi:hypothetical protein
MFSRGAANTNFLVFDLTQSGLDPMTFHTHDEHANHAIIHILLDGVIFPDMVNLTKHETIGGRDRGFHKAMSCYVS